MKIQLALLLTLTLVSLSIPSLTKAACPSSINGNDISIVDSDNCSLTAGNTYIDKATTEASSTNTGTLTINSGGSLTIINGATLYTPTFTVNTGGILYIQNGGIINIGGTEATGVWVTDADADGWAGNLTTTYNATAAGRRRLGLMRSASTLDCYDQNYNARPDQTSCFNTSRGDGSYDYDCNGSSTKCSPILTNSSTSGGTGYTRPCIGTAGNRSCGTGAFSIYNSITSTCGQTAGTCTNTAQEVECTSNGTSCSRTDVGPVYCSSVSVSVQTCN